MVKVDELTSPKDEEKNFSESKLSSDQHTDRKLEKGLA